MGKFNKKLGKNKKPTQLEVVPREQETEVHLKEIRRSDDVVPKKVISKNCYNRMQKIINIFKF